MKMREWLEAASTPEGIEMTEWMVEGAEFYVLKKDHPILDAEVIGVPCPDCADAPVTVVEPEAWEAFVCAVAGYAHATTRSSTSWPKGSPEFNEEWRPFVEKARLALQALLPGARVAESIVPIKQGTKMWSAEPLPGRHCEVAILATQAREEVEDE